MNSMQVQETNERRQQSGQ